jgi:hypothetical protein
MAKRSAASIRRAASDDELARTIGFAVVGEPAGRPTHAATGSCRRLPVVSGRILDHRGFTSISLKGNLVTAETEPKTSCAL